MSQPSPGSCIGHQRCLPRIHAMQYSRINVEDILAEAIEITSTEERRAFVENACLGDTAKQERVERLIRNHFRAGTFLEHPAAIVETTLMPTDTESPGARIGPYKLLEQIGEGGFGVVFLAEQLEPVRRQVALKVIKPGMDSKRVIARFEAERQALALMDHPNIAKVLDAGTTHGVRDQGSELRNQPSEIGGSDLTAVNCLADSSLTPASDFLNTDLGRPYFVMELVRGLPITDYSDEHRLSVRQRLEL